ncbi:MAG: hypothetical protein J5802_14900 [Butyrivibrio sp.]|nr:hypothetical protein [Butyrivibrio sp.]
MLVRLLCPLAYSLILGGVWSACFKKKFSNSLAPAYMLHILLVLISGMLFKRLSYGIYGGLAIAGVIGAFLLIKNRKAFSRQGTYEYFKKMWNEGGFIFLTFYVFCFVINFKKCFMDWDEFSHWGFFLKESLRLDSLYCMSPIWFSHKDYVPAITLFETIWCRLSGRFTEPDAYRGIQIFMFSMLMPIFERISEHVAEKTEKCADKVVLVKCRLFQLSVVLIVLLIPLLFDTKNGFCFYHSVYCDIAVGIVFYWCVFEAYKMRDDICYMLFELAVGMSVLVLAKMMAMALMPLVVAVIFVQIFLLSKGKKSVKLWGLFSSSLIVPVALWFLFNKFVDKYVGNTGGGQSYDGMKLSSLKEVFTSPENSAIPYLIQVKNTYIDALIHWDILIHGSYVVVILFAAIGFWVLAHFCDEEPGKKKMVLAGIWTLGAGVFYALLMYFLYCTAFSEYEAVRLASYERYMNSFVIAVLFLLLAVYFDSGVWKRYLKEYYLLVILLSADLAFFNVDVFDQVLPGTITHDEEELSRYTIGAAAILNDTGEDDSVYIIRRGDDGGFVCRQQYYCCPRTIGGGSVGPAVDEDDVWSRDLSAEEFVETLKGYDYIYFSRLDETFIGKYSGIFDDPAQVVEGNIYRIIDSGSKIGLEKTE